MKEIRGAEAIRYAREMGIHFDFDGGYLADQESLLRGRRASPVDVYLLIDEKLGYQFEVPELVPGNKAFELLVERYGDAWAYVALEGENPEHEEKVTLRLFHRLLEEPNPAATADVRELFRRFGRPRLGRTGFPDESDVNLVFHAALRLVERGALESVEDPAPPRAGRAASYGRRRFILPPDLKVLLVGVLCEECRSGRNLTFFNLHSECARRLRKALRQAN